MTRDEWRNALIQMSGPLAVEAIEDLRPEPELLDVLREAIRLPLPDGDTATSEELELPAKAMALLGILADAGSTDLLVDAMRGALDIDSDWDWLSETIAEALMAVGTPTVPRVVAELERIESDPAYDPFPPSYEMLLARALGSISRTDDDARARFKEIAAQRISNREQDPELLTEPLDISTLEARLAFMAQQADRAEIWVDALIDTPMPELDSAVDEFFTRRGPHYRSPLFGNRAEFLALERETPEKTPRTELIEFYRLYRKDPVKKEMRYSPTLSSLIEEPHAQETVVRVSPKVGRNDPCPCGSGKKYKKCCG